MENNDSQTFSNLRASKFSVKGGETIPIRNAAPVNSSDSKESQLKQAKGQSRMRTAVSDKMDEVGGRFKGTPAGDAADFTKAALDGDVFAAANVALTNPQTMASIWGSALGDFGLSIFLLDIVLVYDAFTSKRLPLWHQLLIIGVTILYVGLLLSILLLIFIIFYAYFHPKDTIWKFLTAISDIIAFNQ